MSVNNPFEALTLSQASSCSGDVVLEPEQEKLKLSHCLERVFLVTLDKDVSSPDKRRPKCSIFLEDLYTNLDNQEWLDVENMSQAMFERTLMTEEQLQKSLIRQQSKSSIDSFAVESRVLMYLSQCYVRASDERPKVDLKGMIIDNASTCLRQPDLYEGQNVVEQMIELMYLRGDREEVMEFLAETFSNIVSSEDLLTLSSILHPLLDRVHQACTRGLYRKICNDAEASTSLKLLHFFTRSQNLAEVLLAYTNTTNPSAIAMEKTLFGTILSSSCAPSSQPGTLDTNQLFENPSRMTQADVELAERMAFSNSAHIIDCMSNLFLKLCQLSPRTRHLLLLWVGRLLHANIGRIKLASIMSPHDAAPRNECSDGLMLNLCAVLLRLCKPFSLPQSVKLKRIWPQYCRQKFTESNDQEAKHHHLWGVPEETYLVQLDESQVNSIEMPSEYNFICDIFFLTHQALHIGVHSTFERFANLNRDLNRIQTAYQQLEATGSPNTEAIKLMFEGAMKRFMCMRVALVDPELLKPALQFHVATSSYLTHLATGGDNSVPFSSLTFPLKEPSTLLLGCIPEHIVTNITDAMSITRRFKESYFQDVIDVAGHFMDLILVFMGSKARLKNPHLRAKLAEVLYEIMPGQEQTTYTMSRLNAHDILKERLFKDHRNVDRLAEVLFDVFVSIESTGDSVEFEQKLSYRQPMYKVIDYMWKMDLHKKAVAQLSNAALADIENTDPPLFLRFVNLLVNDAHFLLDEALGFMKQIREKEGERDSSTSTLRGREREQFEAELAQIINISRFYNSAAVDTTHTLALLTSNCSELFCHSIMVDRICAMLNYFLLMLTGPRMKEFKVKDFDKSEFKPSVIVSEICQIYLNLSHSDEFCHAVSADGRSYSPQLFPQAERVLRKINKPLDMIQAFNTLGARIKNAAAQQMEDDELSLSAPEEFLDALLNTVMKDPVILPSSKQRVDRSTIARHILSDQTDPFDRSPLTLDQITTDKELKSRILAWHQEQRNKQ